MYVHFVQHFTFDIGFIFLLFTISTCQWSNSELCIAKVLESRKLRSKVLGNLIVQVQDQEEETESFRKVVQLREDKIQRLELLSDEKISVESYLNDENKMLAQELQIMQGFITCNPKLAHLSMDNLHLTEQLKRYLAS